jgi:hypothetical protein
MAYGYSGAPNGADRRQSLSRLAPVVEEPGRSASVPRDAAAADIFGSWRTAATTLPGAGRPMQSSAEWLHRQVRCGFPPIRSVYLTTAHIHDMAASYSV